MNEEAIREELQQWLDGQYSQEEQDEFAWYVDEEDEESYSWRFIDHNGHERKLVFQKENERIVIRSRFQSKEQMMDFFEFD